MIFGNCPRTWDSSAGLNFAAQPAQLESWVSLISMVINYDGFVRKSQRLVRGLPGLKDGNFSSEFYPVILSRNLA
jgi:hypothetical protein